jgi:pyruvate,orthophosphate dikinase
MAKRKSAKTAKKKQPARKAASKPVKKAAAKAAKAAPAKAKPAFNGKGKWVYAFGGGKAEGKSGMKNLLGGKGANLAEMANLGLPVPPGFTITTDVCTYY